VQVHIVTHPEENRKRNTGIHAALLAPDHVRLVHFDASHSVETRDSVVLFPADDATLVDTLDMKMLKHVYIIDRYFLSGLMDWKEMYLLLHGCLKLNNLSCLVAAGRFSGRCDYGLPFYRVTLHERRCSACSL
jgi:hypothetical protein